MIRILVSLIIFYASSLMADEVPVNKEHFGCWESRINIGINKVEALCISAESITYKVDFPDHKDKTSCNAKGSLAGFNEDGSRMYLITDGLCSNNNSMGATSLLCEKKGSNLECGVIDLIVFAKENRIEYLYNIQFHPQ